ncbi:hypothetical protein F0562_010625 [Nyssa sinensis]|uniref:Uncharacterized protein n=1 Tax=Nyssa sinensis TaxID=561372 RepID=A0A5J5A353_9ASTE|nr:hypothetical protein F0562_010625 [Nyssa sinensis]
MASNQPFNARIIDSQVAKDVTHSLQATDLASNVHGPDGAAMVAQRLAMVTQGAADTFSSPLISNVKNTQAPPLHTNSSTSAEASQVNSTCHLATASLLMQGDALATNSALRPAIRSSANAAGVHSVEDSFGAGVPITLPASAVCTRETISNSNGLEPSIHSTLGIRDIPNASPDVVSLVANQIGGSPQVSSALNQSPISPFHPQTPVQPQTPVHQTTFVSHEKLSQPLSASV